jgi:hypothetical protein
MRVFVGVIVRLIIVLHIFGAGAFLPLGICVAAIRYCGVKTMPKRVGRHMLADPSPAPCGVTSRLKSTGTDMISIGGRQRNMVAILAAWRDRIGDPSGTLLPCKERESHLACDKPLRLRFSDLAQADPLGE